jgi:hypothetical protein
VNGSGKRTSLLRYDNNYDRKKFYGTGSAGLVSEHCRSFFLAANLPTYAKLVRTLIFYFTFCCRSFENPFFYNYKLRVKNYNRNRVFNRDLIGLLWLEGKMFICEISITTREHSYKTLFFVNYIFQNFTAFL